MSTRATIPADHISTRSSQRHQRAQITRAIQPARATDTRAVLPLTSSTPRTLRRPTSTATRWQRSTAAVATHQQHRALTVHPRAPPRTVERPVVTIPPHRRKRMSATSPPENTTRAGRTMMFLHARRVNVAAQISRTRTLSNMREIIRGFIARLTRLIRCPLGWKELAIRRHQTRHIPVSARRVALSSNRRKRTPSHTLPIEAIVARPRPTLTQLTPLSRTNSRHKINRHRHRIRPTNRPRDLHQRRPTISRHRAHDCTPSGSSIHNMQPQSINVFPRHRCPCDIAAIAPNTSSRCRGSSQPGSVKITGNSTSCTRAP
ncbi:hypothetical protein BH10ACT2_BH10ACT2_11360 [soil metagenome]